MKRHPQLNLLEKQNLAYGGSLSKTRAGRARPRPISTKESMHLVLRSSQATGNWSFRKPKNQQKIDTLIKKYAAQYAIQILSIGNVGNHLHFHLKVGHRQLFKSFLRALTGAIVMAVTGANRWNPLKVKFWDARPFTRVIRGFQAFLNLKDYIELNQIEGHGLTRDEARAQLAEMKRRPWLYLALE